MIRVKKFDEICRNIVVEIGIKGYVICSTDEQGSKKLRDRPGIQLVAVYPNYSFSGEEDSYKDNHELLYYMVVRQKEGASNETEINQYEETQDAIIKLKEYLFGEKSSDNNFCKIFPELNVNSVNIIPEYNIFGGHLGWSMALVV